MKLKVNFLVRNFLQIFISKLLIIIMFLIGNQHFCDRVCKKDEHMVCKFKFDIELHSTLNKVNFKKKLPKLIYLLVQLFLNV